MQQKNLEKEKNIYTLHSTRPGVGVGALLKDVSQNGKPTCGQKMLLLCPDCLPARRCVLQTWQAQFLKRRMGPGRPATAGQRESEQEKSGIF